MILCSIQRVKQMFCEPFWPSMKYWEVTNVSQF